MQNHRIDLGLVEGLNRHPMLKYHPFLKDELVAVVSTKNKLLKSDEISVDELLTIPFVLREQGSGTLDVFKKALSDTGISFADLQVKMYLGSTEGIKLFLQNSYCMSILSIRSVVRELMDGQLRVVDIKDFALAREFCCVQLQGREEGLPQLFMDFVDHYQDTI